jgi:hypothetical protein
MEPEVLAYVVDSNGMVRHLSVTEELLSLLEQLKQQDAKERLGGPDAGATIGQLAQMLKRVMHTAH